MVAYISGHLDTTIEEFCDHYVSRIVDALKQDHSFVVGDAPGTDAICQAFLRGHTIKVTVYHMFDRPRINRGFSTVGGFRSDEERDTAMTAASDYNIAWVRPSRKNSGTARNLERRIKKISIKNG